MGVYGPEFRNGEGGSHGHIRTTLWRISMVDLACLSLVCPWSRRCTTGCRLPRKANQAIPSNKQVYKNHARRRPRIIQRPKPVRHLSSHTAPCFEHEALDISRRDSATSMV